MASSYNNQITLVTSNKSVCQAFQEIEQEYNGQITLRVAYMEGGVSAAKNALESGSRVIVGRGGTALMIERELGVSITNIPLSCADLLFSLDAAKKHGQRICLMSYSNILESLHGQFDYFDHMLYACPINDDKIVEAAVLHLVNEQHIQVFIGGRAVESACQKNGIPFVTLQCGTLSLRQALDNAVRLCYQMDMFSQKQEQFRAVAETSSDGILLFDSKRRIQYANRVASSILARSPGISGQEELELLKRTGLNGILTAGKKVTNRYATINGTSVLLNYVPIQADNLDSGSIMSLQDITKIEALEQQIRNINYSKGFVAKYTFEDIITDNPRMLYLIEQAKRAAQFDKSVLITGETGSGKEMLAQSIHNASDRKNGPFVAINCAALPESLLESELFGYAEGAFTGSRKGGKRGLFELAHKGTFFLDEIGDAPLSVQSRLLRVIQERTISRLGDDKVIPIDIRLIAATNQDLHKLIEQGKFRIDLYYRLESLHFQLPPLRDRPEDLPRLAVSFLQEFCETNKLTPKELEAGASELLSTHTWPGNHREFRSFIEKLAVFYDDRIISAQAVRTLIQEKIIGTRGQVDTAVPAQFDTETKTLKELELEQIKEVLRGVNGDKKKAAVLLGISPSTLWRRLKAMEEQDR